MDALLFLVQIILCGPENPYACNNKIWYWLFHVYKQLFWGKYTSFSYYKNFRIL